MLQLWLPRFALLVILAAACSDRAATEQAGRAPESLSPVRILGDSAHFGNVTLMKVVGDYLAVVDARPDSFWLTVMDRRDGTIRNQIAGVGEGPNEMKGPWFMFLESTDPPRVWTFDLLLARFTLWDLLQPPQLAALDHINFHAPLTPLSRPLLTETGAITADVQSQRTLVLLDSTGGAVRGYVGRAPFSPADFPDRPAAYLRAGDFILTSDTAGDRVALFFKHIDRVDFLDLRSGRLTVRHDRERFPVPEIEVGTAVGWDVLPDVYVSGQDATDRYVYSMYCGCSIEDRNRGRRATVVRIYDWTGSLVAEIHLDRPVSAIAVSPDDSILYGEVTEPMPMIAEWRLPLLETARQEGETS